MENSSKRTRFLSAALFWATVAAFAWLAVNSLAVIGSVYIMIHHDGYHKSEFVVEKVRYTNTSESGLFWGLEGYILGEEKRYYDKNIADGDLLGYQGVHKRFPGGTGLEVLHNPDVTAILVQGRSLNIITPTTNIISHELRRVRSWFLTALLPFVLILSTKIVWQRYSQKRERH